MPSVEKQIKRTADVAGIISRIQNSKQGTTIKKALSE